MKRKFSNYLKSWKNKRNRKPLIIRGARQVGKTYIVEKFADENYKSLFKINFEATPEIKEIFETNDVTKIKQNLELFYGKKINPNSTLLFLDEIQACPKAIITLRYFFEEMPDIHIIAAGSLLDHALNNLQYSMPVGRVEFAYMYPMNFNEFLDAIGENQLVEYLQSYKLEVPIESVIHNRILDLVRIYYLVGGMPEAIKIYNEERSLTDVEVVHESILKSLEYDFGKYGNRTDQEALVKLLKFAPKSIGKKLKYSNVIIGERIEKIKKATKLLSLSRIIHLVYSTSASSVPLEAGVNEKFFKPIFLDIGLANHILKLRLINTDQLIMFNEGDLAEQFIGQQLLTNYPEHIDAQLYYWQREKRNSEAEIDYVTEVNNKVLPIEVKAGKTGRLISLHVYMAEKHLLKAVRFNTDKPSNVLVKQPISTQKKHLAEYNLISLPLYLVGELNRLLSTN